MTVLNDKALEIINSAESMLGYPYVFGAVGEKCIPSLRGRRVNPEHPTIRSKCQVLNGSVKARKFADGTYYPECCNGCKYQGQRMFDCRGFTYYLLKQVGIVISSVGATTQYNRRQDWDEQGEISGIPDVVCCVFMRSGSKMSHTGMHVGGGRIIHCSGEVKTGKASDRGWTHYAIPRGLYTRQELAQAERVSIMTVLRYGNRGIAVQSLQTALTRLGYDCGEADGVFGAKTEAAVRSFQAAEGLTVDGIAGEKTLTALNRLTAAEAPDAAGTQQDTQEFHENAAGGLESVWVWLSAEGLNLRVGGVTLTLPVELARTVWEKCSGVFDGDKVED